MKTRNFGFICLVAGIVIASVVLGAIGHRREQQLAARSSGGWAGSEPDDISGLGSADIWDRVCASATKGRRVQLIGQRLALIRKHKSEKHERYTFQVVGDGCTIDAVYWRNRWDSLGLDVVQSGVFDGNVTIEGKMDEYKGKTQVNVYKLRRMSE